MVNLASILNRYLKIIQNKLNKILLWKNVIITIFLINHEENKDCCCCFCCCCRWLGSIVMSTYAYLSRDFSSSDLYVTCFNHWEPEEINRWVIIEFIFLPAMVFCLVVVGFTSNRFVSPGLRTWSKNKTLRMIPSDRKNLCNRDH